ncbi:MAG: amidohydrolase family protein [Planctomycetota bacterium]|jgi:imidazolonepropionase-like amidohydrolase
MKLPALALLLLTTALIAQDQTTVYKGARVWPGGGAPIDNAVLVIAHGKVLQLGGPDTQVPDDAVIIDVSGKSITPGLIDAAWNGLAPSDQNEQGSESTPALHALDGVDARSKGFLKARRMGVTAVHVMPGTMNVIGGLSAVVKTFALDPTAMVVRDEAALRIALGAEPSSGNRAIRGGSVDSIYYRRPTTRMGVIWEVRRGFYDAQDYLTQTIEGGKPQPNRDLDVLGRVLQGKLAIITTARSEQDLRTALRLGREFGYTPVIDEAQEAHFVIDELAAAKVWVMCSAPSADRLAGSAGQDGAEPRFSTLPALAEKGIPFVITTGTNPLALDLVREATFAVRFGIPAEKALDAITSDAATLLGVADRIGKLATGKDADLVIWSAEPFDPASQPLFVIIDGNQAPTSR